MNITPTFRAGPTHGREDGHAGQRFESRTFVRAHVNITLAATSLNQMPQLASRRRPRSRSRLARAWYMIQVPS